MLGIRWIIRLGSSVLRRNNVEIWVGRYETLHKGGIWCDTLCVVEGDMKMSVCRAVVHCLFCGPSYWSVWVCLLLLCFCEIPVSVEKILFSSIENDRWSTRALTAWSQDMPYLRLYTLLDLCPSVVAPPGIHHTTGILDIKHYKWFKKNIWQEHSIRHC